MNNIERLFYNYGKSFEDFEILYQSEDKKLVLVKNITTKNKNKYSFGTYEEFHSIYSFPVQQSCLTKTGCIKILKKYIKISEEYPILEDINKEKNNIMKEMIKILNKEKVNI